MKSYEFKVQIAGIAGRHDSNLDYATDGKSIEVFTDGALSWARPALIFSVDTDINKISSFIHKKMALLQAAGIEIRQRENRFYTQINEFARNMVTGAANTDIYWADLKPTTSIHAPTEFKVTIKGLKELHTTKLEQTEIGSSIKVYNTNGALILVNITKIFLAGVDSEPSFLSLKLHLLQIHRTEVRSKDGAYYIKDGNKAVAVITGLVSTYKWHELYVVKSIYAPPEKTEQPKKAYDVVLKSRTPGTGYYTYLEPVNPKAISPTKYIVYRTNSGLAEFASIWEIYVYGYDLDFRNKKAKILLDIRATIRKNKTGMFYWREVDGSIVNIETGVKVTEYDWDDLITVNTNDYEQINRTSPAKRAGEREETGPSGRARKALPECLHLPTQGPSNGGRRASKLPAPLLPY